MDAGIQMTSR